MHWNRQAIRDRLSDLRAEIVDNEPGGDYDIIGLDLRPTTAGDDNNAWISIAPFKDPSSNPDYDVQDDCEICALEIRTNGDCRGGCQTTREDVGILYAQVTIRLRADGWRIIDHYDQIF